MVWRRIVLGVSLLLNAVLLYSLIWGSKGVISYREYKEQSLLLEKRIDELKERNLALSKEIHLLKTDANYVEKMIRTRLNFVRENEILYVFPDERKKQRKDEAPGAASNEAKD